MARWQAIGPISLELEDEGFSHGGVSIRKYDKEELGRLLGDDVGYWSPASLSIAHREGYWLKLDFEVNPGEMPWTKAANETGLFLEGLALFKTTLSMLAVAGMRVRRTDESADLFGGFGWEITITRKPYYFLKTSEYDGFISLLDKYRGFWQAKKSANRPDKQLLRIGWGKHYFAKSYQTDDAVERYIFLSIALEALCGEGQDELRYRYSNRVAMLLGDDIERRKAVHRDVMDAYERRSKILHGGTRWRIEPRDISKYSEVMRQAVLRSISLSAHEYPDLGKVLDECLHDPGKHAKLLEDAKALFGTVSEFKEPEETFQATL